MSSYKIVSRDSMVAFEEAADALLKTGYEPVGSLQLIEHPRGDKNYIQGFVRKH